MVLILAVLGACARAQVAAWLEGFAGSGAAFFAQCGVDGAAAPQDDWDKITACRHASSCDE